MNDRAPDASETRQRFDPFAPDSAAAFEHAPVSLSVSDPHGRIIFANRRFWTLFGHEPDESLDVGLLSRPSDEEWSLSYLTRLITGDIDEYTTVKRFVRGDGTEFDGHLSISALRGGGRCTGMIASVEPIDVRPPVNDGRLRKLLEHAVGTTTLVEIDGTVITTSGRYRAMLGYPTEFWQERSILDLIVPEDLDIVRKMREEVVADPSRQVTGDVRVRGADRSVRTLEVTVLNMVDDADLDGFVLSTRDVTVERQNMRALARLRDEAIAEAEQRSHLLATVSHELRNPLHAMSGIVELLASDETLGDSPRSLAGSLLRQLQHLTSVTDDLLDTARLTVGRFELHPVPVAVRDLVDDVVRVARSSAAGRLEITESVAAEVPDVVTADPARLQQILGNLLGNAVKFTERGTVDLAVSLTVDAGGVDHLVFEVSDTGVGIPAEQIPRIFQPFSTASTSGDRRGAGLGLSIVQRLTEALGGTIDVRSDLGRGSVFTTTIPAIDAVKRAATPTNESSQISRPASVLVVEDTPVNQEVARHQLARLGMQCTIAPSAEDGLARLAERTFDAILMDHQLPGMNGRDATREIRRLGITTPIIGITASSTAADERACIEAGMSAFLPKPVGLARLSAALDAVLDGTLDGNAPTATVEASTDDRVAIDADVLDQLVDELGDREIVAGLVRTFLDELDARESDITASDADLAARQAHTLKSSARLLGAGRLSRVCAAVETDTVALGEVSAAASDARVGLRAWLDSVNVHDGSHCSEHDGRGDGASESGGHHDCSEGDDSGPGGSR